MATRKKLNYTYASGRRRSSSARARIYKGKDTSLVNNTPVDQYFPGKVYQTLWENPFKLTDTLGKYYTTIKVVGGGKKGQLDASIHAVAKAFSNLDREKFRAPLKKAGLLTRDARIRERRKVGTGGKARRKKQSPKR